MVTVNILLSTYNGEKYLSDQIESILNQTFKGWTLLIRDDDSSDSTAEIIKGYESKDARIKFINKNKIENIGIHKSFKSLAKFSDADWYFLCDQDDVWLPNKIENMLNYTGEKSEEAKLVYSDLTTVDSNLNIISERIRNSKGHEAPILKDYLLQPTVTGCAVMFNRNLRNYWLLEKKIIGLHDSMLGFLAASLGSLEFINESYTLYRQHSENVVGSSTVSGIHAILQSFWGQNQLMNARACDVLETFSSISDKNKKVLKEFIKLNHVGLLGRFKVIIKYRYRYSLGGKLYSLFGNLLLLSNVGNKGVK